MRDHKTHPKTNSQAKKSSSPNHVNSTQNPTSKLPSSRHTQIQPLASETDTASINSLPGFRKQSKVTMKFSKTCKCSTLLLLASNYYQAQAVEFDSVYSKNKNLQSDLQSDYQNHPPQQVVFYEDNFNEYNWIALEDEDDSFYDYAYEQNDYNTQTENHENFNSKSKSSNDFENFSKAKTVTTTSKTQIYKDKNLQCNFYTKTACPWKRRLSTVNGDSISINQNSQQAYGELIKHQWMQISKLRYDATQDHISQTPKRVRNEDIKLTSRKNQASRRHRVKNNRLNSRLNNRYRKYRPNSRSSAISQARRAGQNTFSRSAVSPIAISNFQADQPPQKAASSPTSLSKNSDNSNYIIYDATRQEQRVANTCEDADCKNAEKKRRKKYRRHQFIAFRNSPYWMKQASSLRAEYVSPNFVPTPNRCLSFRYIIPYVQNKRNKGRGNSDDAAYKIWPFMSRLEVFLEPMNGGTYGPGLSVSKIPLWTKVSTTDNKWQTVKVPIHTKMQIFERSKPDINIKNYFQGVKVVFSATGGRTRNTIIALDDLSFEKCEQPVTKKVYQDLKALEANPSFYAGNGNTLTKVDSYGYGESRSSYGNGSYSPKRKGRGCKRNNRHTKECQRLRKLRKRKRQNVYQRQNGYNRQRKN